ncbi:MAG TPA: TetR/AcrR family transcriptional regulator [Roseiflexaceae bacterium]|nr:TetR/AcrR family transcriptional regulator [Roseiflexaceae bacterium]
MRTKNKTGGQKALSFIEAARRAQIIACAIDTIAEQGYAQASLAQIGQRAGISKGVITYHFASKDELLGAAAGEILRAFAAFVVPRMEAEQTVSGELRAFLEANAAFLQAHRASLLALLEIMRHARSGGGEQHLVQTTAETDITQLAALLEQGQREGELRSFDPVVMAVSIMALRNSMIERFAADPGLDLTAYARELATFVELATRRLP